MKTGRWQDRGAQSDKRLSRMVTLSAVLHLAAIAALIIGASWSRSSQTLPVAYTVELVNPAALGTSLPAKGKPTRAPQAVEEKPASPPPPPQPEVKKPQEEMPVVKQKEPPKPEPLAQPKEVVKLPQKEKPVEKPPVKAQPEKAKPPEKKPEPKKAETKPAVEKAAAKPPEKKTEPRKAETPPPSQSPEERDEQIISAVERIRAVERVRAQVREGERNRQENALEDGPGVGSGPATLGGAPGEGGGGVVRGLEFIMYTDRVKRRVKESWIVAEAKPGLTATVRFGIMPDGKVFSIELMQPSGDGAFDQSVLRAVRAADPLPPPPQMYQQEFATQKVEVIFGGEERAN
ncbi:MAG: cell envelope integrity protein TolA [Candidatus Binatia bacterium]